MSKVYPLDTLANIRAALRKNTVQTAIYKNQAEAGGHQTDALLAYIGFMSEDECKAFLNSVREAPFIPNINLMWTQQIVEYLMLSNDAIITKFRTWCRAQDAIEFWCKDDEVSYSTKYVQNHVDKAYWHMLPKGWSAKYYHPSSVLKIAVICEKYTSMNNFCKYIAEKLFIKAADLEDCLVPTTKLPSPLPKLPEVEKPKRKKNEIVLKDFPEGSHIAIDVPKPDQPVVPKVFETPKLRHNPVVAATPRFAAGKGYTRRSKKQREEIDAILMARYAGFGGTDTARQLSELLGIPEGTVSSRVHMIREQNPQLPREKRRMITSEFLESIKARLACFGGTESKASLAKEFGVDYSTVSKWVKRIHACMAVPTN